MSVFGVILVRIFPHSDWIRRDMSISPYSVQMRENTDQNNSEYRHFFTYCHLRPMLLCYRDLSVDRSANQLTGFCVIGTFVPRNFVKFSEQQSLRISLYSCCHSNIKNTRFLTASFTWTLQWIINFPVMVESLALFMKIFLRI